MYPVFFTSGKFSVATYGLFVALGYGMAILYLRTHLKEMGLTKEKFWKEMYLLLLGAILGGKLLYIVLHGMPSADGLREWLQWLQSGFVFYGGFLGALGIGWWYAHQNHLDFGRSADYFGPAIALGHAIGRWGCFATGCCYGKPTSLPWGVSFPNSLSSVDPQLSGVPLHPVQLYESLGNLAIFLVLHFLYIKPASGGDGHLVPGGVFLRYVLFYAFLRFGVELLRGDDRGWLLLGFSVSQIVALAAAVLALVSMRLLVTQNRGRNTKQRVFFRLEV
jgi:phosphatidylglycerol:prolipoprotein diacylglycerol transferase